MVIEAGHADKPTPNPPQQYRMIAIDLDGTLLSPTGEVSPRTRSAVRAAVAAGWTVCFATGRTWTESQAALDDVGHYDAAVFVGGAMVVDTANRVVLHRTIMHPSLAAEVCAFFESRGHAALALQDRAASDVDYLVSAHPPMDASTQLWMRVSRAEVRAVPHLGSYEHEHTVRVSIVEHPARTAQLMAELKADFAGRVIYHSVGVHAYEVDVLEVFDPAVDKWQGILRVAAARGIEPSQVIAIGDNMNDLPMIRSAGLGVAMGNAKPDVKAVAGRVIGGNDADGLAVYLEELVAA